MLRTDIGSVYTRVMGHATARSLVASIVSVKRPLVLGLATFAFHDANDADCCSHSDAGRHPILCPFREPRKSFSG
jgi:hypothetical protein